MAACGGLSGGEGNIRRRAARHTPAGPPSLRDGVLRRLPVPGRTRSAGAWFLQSASNHKRATRWVALLWLVEAAGIEPASASPLPSALHAYPGLL